jgi:outer membrane protein assembly factor BamB
VATLYLSSQSGIVYALNTATGAKLWQWADPYNISSAPAALGGAVHVCGDDGTLIALRASDGALAWTAQAGGHCYGSPVVAP